MQSPGLKLKFTERHSFHIQSQKLEEQDAKEQLQHNLSQSLNQVSLVTEVFHNWFFSPLIILRLYDAFFSIFFKHTGILLSNIWIICKEKEFDELL